MGSSRPQTGAPNLVNARVGAPNSSNIVATARATDGSASTTAATQGPVPWQTIDPTFAQDLMSATRAYASQSNVATVSNAAQTVSTVA